MCLKMLSLRLEKSVPKRCFQSYLFISECNPYIGLGVRRHMTDRLMVRRLTSGGLFYGGAPRLKKPCLYAIINDRPTQDARREEGNSG